jgi:hypothetical protein
MGHPDLCSNDVYMSQVPISLTIFFLFTTLVALFGFGKAVRGSKVVIGGSVLWMGLQSAVALSGFYLVTKGLPPHLLLAVGPPVVLIAVLFATASGRTFLDGMELKWCVLIHTVRVLVELNLYWLFLYKQVPALMTFEDGNLDILAGISAPIIWWLFRTGRVGRRGLLIWNSLCLLGVLNAFVRAMLSAPFPFQKFGFDQPTVAILSFPFVLLPAFVVPAVILCHLVVFRKLWSSGSVEDDV